MSDDKDRDIEADEHVAPFEGATLKTTTEPVQSKPKSDS